MFHGQPDGSWMIRDGASSFDSLDANSRGFGWKHIEGVLQCVDLGNQGFVILVNDGVAGCQPGIPRDQVRNL